MYQSWVALPSALLFAAIVSCSSASTGPAERVFELEVAAQRAPCVGLFPTECLQVRERADAPWELFYDAIEGFTYEPGFRYVLSVAQRPIPKRLADGSSFAYRLLAVVSKVPSP